jgi:hypothetical protein
LIPHPSAAEPGQNWHAESVEALWDKPMVGTKGPTVGDEIIASLQPGGEIRNEIESLRDSFLWWSGGGQETSGRALRTWRALFVRS